MHFFIPYFRAGITGVDSSITVSIRTITEADQKFLWEMLYQALYVPEDSEPPPRDIVRRPEISRYAADWSNRYDMGFIAIEEIKGRAIGAAWIRPLTGVNRGYGYIDDVTPELSTFRF